MKSPYKTIVAWKKADLALQLLSALLILLFARIRPQLVYTGMCVLCGLQCLGITLWLYLLSEEPNRLWLGLPVRFACMLVASVSLASCCSNDPYFMAYLVLLTYPVLGPAYLLLTFSEVLFYHRLHKKEPV